MSDILELINFQDVLNQIAREEKTGRAGLADIARMREWQQENWLWNALHLRYWSERNAGNWITANHIFIVLDECRPRWCALDTKATQ